MGYQASSTSIADIDIALGTCSDPDPRMQLQPVDRSTAFASIALSMASDRMAILLQADHEHAVGQQNSSSFWKMLELATGNWGSTVPDRTRSRQPTTPRSNGEDLRRGVGNGNDMTEEVLRSLANRGKHD
jgi:hypothetical protein